MPVVLPSFLFQRHAESSTVVTLLQQRLQDDKKELQKIKDEVKKVKAAKAREEQRESENISPDPGGMAVFFGTFGTVRATFTFEFSCALLAESVAFIISKPFLGDLIGWLPSRDL
jgi:hypothetical protein